MIGRLCGILREKAPPLLLLDVNGIGYEVEVPMSTFYSLPATGEQVTLLTHLSVREDAHLLYGFLTAKERSVFRELVKVSGVGAKSALAILSGLSTDELAHAVATQNATLLTRIPGIGKKTAERLLLELKGKLSGSAGSAPALLASPPASANSDVLNALLALGYNEREALAAIKLLAPGLPVGEGIRQALKELSRT